MMLDISVPPRVIESFRHFDFTPREQDVVIAVLEGLKGHEIAGHLCLAPSTVNDYLQHTLEKTGARTRPQMVALVMGWRPLGILGGVAIAVNASLTATFWAM